MTELNYSAENKYFKDETIKTFTMQICLRKKKGKLMASSM